MEITAEQKAAAQELADATGASVLDVISLVSGIVNQIKADKMQDKALEMPEDMQTDLILAYGQNQAKKVERIRVSYMSNPEFRKTMQLAAIHRLQAN